MFFLEILINDRSDSPLPPQSPIRRVRGEIILWSSTGIGVHNGLAYAQFVPGLAGLSEALVNSLAL